MGRKPNKPDPIAHWPLRCTAARYRDRSGTREWYWRARDHRTGAQRKLGWIPDGARKEVESAVHRLAGAQLAAGGFELGSERSGARGVPKTVEELLERYLEERRDSVFVGDMRDRPRVRGQITAETMRKYEVSAGHLNAWIGDVLLSELNKTQLQRYAVGRRHNDQVPARSDRTVANELLLLRFAVLFGAERGWCSRIDTMVVDPDPNLHVNNRRTPTLAEVRLVLARLPEPYRLTVELLAWSGARVAEITGDPAKPGSGLRVSDVDLHHQVLHVVGKGNRRRELPLHPVLARRLAPLVEGRDPDELVLEAGDQERSRRTRGWPGVYKQRVSRELQAACAAAAVPTFTPQGLRRLADDQLYDANSDPGTSAGILGHSPEVALRNYRRARMSRRREVMVRAGLGAVLNRDDDNVVELPTRAATADLSGVSVDDLLEELRRRGAGGDDLEENLDEGSESG